MGGEAEDSNTKCIQLCWPCYTDGGDTGVGANKGTVGTQGAAICALPPGRTAIPCTEGLRSPADCSENGKQQHGPNYNYAIGLCLLLQFCKTTRVVKYREVKSFFISQWAPMVLEIHQPGGDILNTFTAHVSTALDQLPTHKVVTTNQVS